MVYNGTRGEILEIVTLTKFSKTINREWGQDEFIILWNIEGDLRITINDWNYQLKPNEMLFLGETHLITKLELTKVRIIRFNPLFYCVVNHDLELGCKGLLFFVPSEPPLIPVDNLEIELFQNHWNSMCKEIILNESYQLEMLQAMLKRFIILCTRIYKKSRVDWIQNHFRLEVIREFNFLVEKHFKRKHAVKDYANMLNKSAKTLSNIFALHYHKSPLQIIQDRILLQASRELTIPSKSISDVAYEMGFPDLQSFSRFFKKKKGISPKQYLHQCLVFEPREELTTFREK